MDIIPYNVLKALHIIAFTAWMAGMFYLPRLFVYHVDAPKGSTQSETFKLMERRLLRYILNPAMILTWIFGVLMLLQNQAVLGQGWFHAKVTLLVLMQITHAVYARARRHFEQDRNTSSARFYRIINEIPTVLLIGIVLLVVLKPF